MSYSSVCGGRRFSFQSIKEILAKANELKSGDVLAGVAAESEQERVAAKQVLSDISMETLRNNPIIDAEVDEVTRAVDDALDQDAYAKVKNWSVSQLREFLLDQSTGAEEIAAIQNGLTGEMVAAVTKLMSNMELIRAGKKFTVVATARTTLGLPGVLGARLQPNHPADAIEGIKASIYEGLSYGIGDAVIGINPVYDTADTVGKLLNMTNEVIERLGIPTQNCILSHVTTQMKAIERGAPFGLIFQSIAGSEAGNRAFGIDLAMLKEALELGLARSNTGSDYVMYFETGQGSELSSNTHFQSDQVTLEARCYTLARLFKPFLVNDVVGFIGPEYLADGKQMTRAGLEDHFMGKLTGVPMGIDACYTNHTDADQNDLENLSVLLAAAGVNYFMGVPMGDDVMLSYQTTSFHDVASLRELMNLRPAPEFERWLEKTGLMNDGKLTKVAGDASYVMDLAKVSVN